jgi:hypothetical protein
MPEGQNFKRINFFEGFFTTDEDWNAAEAYHLEKRRLHNKILHQPGLVPIFAGGLRVTSRGKGDLSFEVAPGFAIDGRGNEIVLRDPAVKVIELEKLKLPQTVYVGVRYYEEPTDFIAYKENPRFKGHRRIEEKCKVEVLARPPDNDEVIELGRIRLEEGVREIRDALDTRLPGPGELDLRYAPVAGIAGGHATPSLRVELSVGLSELQSHTAALSKTGVITANYVRHQAAAAEMLNSANAVGPSNLSEVLTGLVELSREMVEEIEKNHPNVGARKGFNDYKKSLEALQKLVRDRPRDIEGCAGIVRFLNSANQSLQAVAKEKSGPVAKGPDAVGEKVTWKDIVFYSKAFPSSLNIDGSNFAQVDHIKLVDDESTKTHKFVIEGQKDMWKSRQNFSYPDKVEVSDAGVAYIGGQSKFNVLNLKPGKDLIVIKRYDAILGEQQCEILADGKKVGTWKTAEIDRKHRWRNHYFLVPGTFVTGESLEIVKKATSAERDINMFQLWFYQPA